MSGFSLTQMSEIQEKVLFLIQDLNEQTKKMFEDLKSKLGLKKTLADLIEEMMKDYIICIAESKKKFVKKSFKGKIYGCI